MNLPELPEVVTPEYLKECETSIVAARKKVGEVKVSLALAQQQRQALQKKCQDQGVDIADLRQAKIKAEKDLHKAKKALDDSLEKFFEVTNGKD